MLSEQVKDFRAGHKHLVRFIRTAPKRAGQRKGVVIAFKDEDSGMIRFGWSCCNPLDSFNEDIGFVKAVSNSVPFAYHDASYDGESIDALSENVVRQADVPHSLRDHARKLVRRAYSYYKLVPSQSPKG